MGLSEHLNIKSLPAHFSITKVIWMIAPRRIHISACYFFNHKVICFYRLPFAVFASQRFKRRFLHLAADRQPVVTERALWFLRIILPQKYWMQKKSLQMCRVLIKIPETTCYLKIKKTRGVMLLNKNILGCQVVPRVLVLLLSKSKWVLEPNYEDEDLLYILSIFCFWTNHNDDSPK